MGSWRLIYEWCYKGEPVVEDPVAICERDHKEDHACWDHLAPVPCPGRECWFCNKCKRSWSMPNERPSACIEPTVGLTYTSGFDEEAISPRFRDIVNKRRRARDEEGK